MNYRAILAASAAVSFVFSSTAAVAQDDDDVDLSSYYSQQIIGDTSGMTPDQICAATLHPAVPSGFTAVAQNITPGPLTNVGAAYPDLDSGPIPGTKQGFGTPTVLGLTFNGTYYRNGGSPNVWGGATAGTVIYPQTRALYNFLQNVTQTTTFDCYVSKVTKSGHLVVPPGLQTTGDSLIVNDTIPATPPTDYFVTDDQFPDNSGSITVITLICISPNNTTKSKPGTWTQKHGFTGSCTTASSLAGGSIPSGNAPTTDSDTVFFPH